MRIRTMVFTAATLGLGTGSCLLPQASAQPLYDRVHVSMPYTTTVGQETLPPGDYTIQQQRSDGSNVLYIYNGDGMKFITSVMTNKALDPNTARRTEIVLHHLGDNYYYDKIWIQGKDYGYQIPLPDSVRRREKEMASMTVPAEATTTSTPTDFSTSNTTATNTTTTTANAADNNNPSTPSTAATASTATSDNIIT